MSTTMHSLERLRAGSRQRAIVAVAAVAVLHASFLSGCVRYRPAPLDAVPFRERAVVEEQDGIRVEASALGRKEAETLFGVPLGRLGVQPVWLRIANGTDNGYLFLQQTVDPDYFAPAEAAYKSRFSPTKRVLGYGLVSLVLWPLLLVTPFQYFSARHANREMEEVFVSRGIGNRYISPGETIDGFVFTRIDEGTKGVPLKLLSSAGTRELKLFVQVPGGRADHTVVDFAAIEEAEPLREVDEAGLREALSELPCCTKNARGTREGDPLNLVIIGSFEDLLTGLTRAGWDETDVLDVTSGLQTARAFVFNSEYRYSPVSNLYVYERPQDVAFQKARETIHERNHLRLWLSPLRLDGTPVWVGQISRDIGVRFTTATWNLTTHAIDPDVDDSREAVVGDLLHTERVEALDYVPGPPASTPDEPQRNLTGDPYHTDGLRVIVLLADEPTEPEFLFERSLD